MPWKNKPLIITHSEDVDYYLFVDESGDHILNSGIFTISGVIIKKDDYSHIEDEINTLKARYWENATFSPLQNIIKKVCFISRDIRKEQKAFSRYYLSKEQYSDFINDLTDLMQRLEYKIISYSIDKDTLSKQEMSSMELYHVSMEFITSKFVKFLQNNDSTGLIMMEARGKKEDSKLHLFFLDIYNNGLNNLSYKVFKNTMKGGFYFNEKWDKQKNNLETFCGLELADLVAHPIGHYVKTKVKSRPFLAFESKFLGFKNYMYDGLNIYKHKKSD